MDTKQWVSRFWVIVGCIVAFKLALFVITGENMNGFGFWSIASSTAGITVGSYLTGFSRRLN